MIIRTNDRAIEKGLKALEKIIMDNGGWIHSNFTIRHNDKTGLSVHMEGNCLPLDCIIKVPEDLLIPVDPINLSAKGSEFVVDPDADNLSPAQLEITRHMISIYNLTNKVRFHKHACPWIRFSEAPELMYQLLHARTMTINLQSKQNFMYGIDKNKTIEEFVSETFISTRAIGYKSNGDEQTRRFIMPIIDYMNHNYRGSGYMSSSKDEVMKGLRIKNRQPHVGSQECYVIYGICDGLDTFLVHGFYDQETPFIRSIPLEIPVKGAGKIIVRSYSDVKNKIEVSKQTSDLKQLMPSVKRMKNGNIEISHLFITVGQFPNALRRVLSIIFRHFTGKGINKDLALEQIKNVEKMVVNKNIGFYNCLLGKLDDNSTAPPKLVSDIRQIAEFQLGKLNQYYFDDTFYTRAEVISDYSMDGDAVNEIKND